ncbi:MAG: DUF2165 family protein [Pseudomonadota bacterium]
MMETVVLIAQACATVFLAGWITAGVKDNIQHPDMNRTFTSMVLRMERMEELYPEHFEIVKHRRIKEPRLLNMAYGFIVLCESIAALLLWAGAVFLLFALVGWAQPETAKSAALVGALAFTSVWAGFLIFGNHFGYWYAHEAAQNTHFQLVIWGIATMVFLTV